VVPASGGTPRRITNAANGPGDPRQASDRQPQWSPKGRWILFETGRRGHNNMMVVSEDGMATDYLTAANVDEEGASWSPDGTRISYTARAPEYFSGKLNVLKFDPAKGQAAADPVTLYTSPTDRGGGWSIRRAQWSPDGRTLAVVLQDSGWDNIYLISASGGAPKALTHGEYEDTNPVFSPDGKSLAIVSSRRNLEESDIWIAPVDGSAPRQLAKFTTPGVESQPEWSPDGSRIYFHRNSPMESTDLLVAAQDGSGTPKYLTHTTPKNFETGLVMPEEVHFRSKDGMDVAAMLHKPRGFKAGTKYPAVLWIHGGPEGQDTFRFDSWPQYLAQSGYVVLQPNYRGSTGYGERFRNLNVEDSGGGEIDDVGAEVKYLVDQGLADPKRVAIGGGSHGGTVVANAVVELPGVFAAAMDLYGVVDRALFLQYTNRNSRIRWETKMGGTPEEKPEVYRKANVLADVARIQTPLLILHGEEDPQVPPQESAQFAAALRQAGKTYLYFTYPHEGHGFTGREHRLDAWRRQLAFLREYLQPAGEKSSAAQP